MYCLFPRRSFLATRLYSKRSSLAGRNHFRKYLLHSLAVRGVDMTSGCQPCLSPLLPPHNQKGPRTRLKQLLQLFSSSLNTAKIAISQEVSFSNLFCCNRMWELGLKVTGGCKKKKKDTGWEGEEEWSLPWAWIKNNIPGIEPVGVRMCWSVLGGGPSGGPVRTVTALTYTPFVQETLQWDKKLSSSGICLEVWKGRSRVKGFLNGF